MGSVNNPNDEYVVIGEASPALQEKIARSVQLQERGQQLLREAKALEVEVKAQLAAEYGCKVLVNPETFELAIQRKFANEKGLDFAKTIED